MDNQDIHIILIDRGGLLLSTILNKTDWFIDLLSIDDYTQDRKSEYSNDRIASVYSMADFLAQTDVEKLNYTDIKKYKSIQPLADAGYRRISNDYQGARDDFYTSIGFWEKFLHEHSVNFCIIVESLHGFRCDAILQNIAKSHGIICYNIAPQFAYMWSIFNAYELNLVEKFNSYDIDSLIDTNKFYSRNEKDDIEKRFGKFASWIYSKTGYVFCKIALHIFRRNSIYAMMSHHPENVLMLCYYYYRVNRLNDFYETQCHCVDYSQKYMVFYLHFEPEATIQGNAEIMDSQIVAIRMLASAMPNGWVLYVKEHPDQWKLNTYSLGSHLTHILNFRSKQFYKTIAAIDHVELISSIHQDNKKLMQNAKAIATFTGTIALEATDYQKPIFLFASDKGVYRYCKGFFHVHSTADCREGMKKVAEGYVPDYSDLPEMCNKYLFPWTEEGREMMIQTVQKDLEERLQQQPSRGA